MQYISVSLDLANFFFISGEKVLMSVELKG